jgi:hypothetical protein
MKLRGEDIPRLKTLPYDQIVPAVQATIKRIGSDMLPSLKGQIQHNAERVLSQADEIIEREITAIMRTWPSGGLSLATQFISRLRGDAGRFAEALQRREAAYQGRNQQHTNYLNQLGPALKNAVASVPSYPIMALALIGGLLAPLGIVSIWLWQGLGSSSGVVATIVVWLLALGGVAYTAWRTLNGVEEIRDQYVARLNDRFQTEIDMASVQAAGTLYPDLVTIADAKIERLTRFAGDLQRTARALKHQLDSIPLHGDVDFAMQRSVLTPETVDLLYDRYLGPGKTEARLAPLIEETGSLEQWLDRPTTALESQLLIFGRRVFEGMRELSVEELLQKQLAGQPQTRVEFRVRELTDKAAPLWTYNPFALGQTYTLSDQTIVGLEAPSDSAFRQQFSLLNPSTLFEASGDRHSIIVTMLRRGMPLFGLQRLSQFQTHYVNTVKSHGLPLHVDDEAALAPDLMPSSVERTDLDPPTAFALGVAANLIKQRDGGSPFVVTNLDGKTLGTLATDRIESVILLTIDEKLLGALVSQVNAWAQTGTTETTEALDQYLETAQVSAWERSRIERFRGLLQS